MTLDHIVSEIYWPAHLTVDGELFDALYITDIDCIPNRAVCKCATGQLIDPYNIFSPGWSNFTDRRSHARAVPRNSIGANRLVSATAVGKNFLPNNFCSMTLNLLLFFC